MGVDGPKDGPTATIQGRTDVILVTRLNGPVFALNPDLIERADSTPDTVVSLVDGTKYVIAESVPELVELVRNYRASVLARAERLESGRDVVDDLPPERRYHPAGNPAPVVRLHPRES